MTSERLGRCYELAYHKVVELHGHGHAGTLVHGVIRDTHLIGEGAVICHGWVELGGIVWEPISERTLPTDVFMRLYDAEVVHRYDAKEAARLALDTGHSGPWHEMPDGIQRTLGQIEEERV